MEFHQLNRIDPLHKQVEGDMEIPQGISPMDPPNPYMRSNLEAVATEALHPFLRELKNEHAIFMEEINTCETALLSIQKDGYSRETDTKLREFFSFIDSRFLEHNRREEIILFPLLRKRLIASGEHGVGEVPVTAIEVMEGEHAKALQLAAVIVNFLGLAFRLPDEKSSLMVLDAALEQGKAFVELLRLHIFREDNIIFSLAHRLISFAEFDEMR